MSLTKIKLTDRVRVNESYDKFVKKQKHVFTERQLDMIEKTRRYDKIRVM